MKKKRDLIPHIANILCIALIIECFLCAIMAVRKHAREDCFDRIEETTYQMAAMYNHALEDTQDKLNMFADILAANSSNPEELLLTYMKNFCKTHYVSALCIHRANGVITSYGEHPHAMESITSFEEEVSRLPYVSELHIEGDLPQERYYYHAVPVVRNGETLAVLYGFISMDYLPAMFTSTAYDGKGQLYIVDGNTGEFMLDTWHEGPLNNIFDKSMSGRETKPGYDVDELRNGVCEGRRGYYIFKSRTIGEWFYTYYMPLGVNNWSIQLTIDEPTAFARYDRVNRTVMVLFVSVVILMLVHVITLMIQGAHTKKGDKDRLRKSNYMYEVQHELLNAHNDPAFIEQALRTVANETGCETMLLLRIEDRVVKDVYFWPSADKHVVAGLTGRNIREDFPNIYDRIISGDPIHLEGEAVMQTLNEEERGIFREMDVRSVMTVPIRNSGNLLKGVLCAVNLKQEGADPEMLQCVTYDFFMAVTNVENHAIIRRMGMMDYLTNVKNRNCYEAELHALETMDCDSLWCVFVDVNGLHEINNSHGHKAGDLMLSTIADVFKRTFGEQYAYRMGGDEFVAFVKDMTQEALERKRNAVVQTLAAQNYHVSVGFFGTEKPESGVFDVARIVTEAENAMYCEKREFYQRNNIPVEREHVFK